MNDLYLFGPQNLLQSGHPPSLPVVDHDAASIEAADEKYDHVSVSYPKTPIPTEANRAEDPGRSECLHSGRFEELLKAIAAEYHILQARLLSTSSLSAQPWDLNQFGSCKKGCSHSDSNRTAKDREICAHEVPMVCNERVLRRWRRLVEMLSSCGAADRIHCTRDCWGATHFRYDEPSQSVASDMSFDSVSDNIVFMAYCQLKGGGIMNGSGNSGMMKVMSSINSMKNASVRRRIVNLLHRASKVQPCVIYPSSFKRLVWNLITLLMILFDFAIFSIELFVDLDAAPVGHIKVASLVFWCLDICVSFLTAVYVNGELCTNLKRIARHYLTTWLPFDLLCTVPACVQLHINSASSDTHFSSALRTLRIFRSARLLRVVKLRDSLIVILRSIGSIYVNLLARSCGAMIVLAMFIHANGCIWFTLGNQPRGWVQEYGILDETPFYQYLVSVHWAGSQLQGSTDISPGSTLGERIFAVVALVSSIVALGIFVSSLTNFTIEIHKLSKKHNNSEVIRTYFRKFSVSYDTQMRVRSFLDVTSLKISMQQEDEAELAVLKHLPTLMRRQVVNEAHSQYLISHPVFLAVSGISQRCLERICCDVLRASWAVPDEIIFGFGEVSAGMYFVVRGNLVYLRYPGVLQNFAVNGKTLQLSGTCPTMDGIGNLTNRAHDRHQIVSEKRCSEFDNMSEAVLWTHWAHCGDLTAYNHALLFTLPPSDFASVVSAYALVQEVMSSHAALFVAVLIRLRRAEMSDMFGTMEVMEEHERAHPGKIMHRMKVTET